MLLSFTVGNYRSFDEPVTLDMRATAEKPPKGLGPYDPIYRHVMELSEADYPKLVKADRRLLRFAAIYGPNASGKSNLLRALGTLRNFVLDSYGSRGFLDSASPYPYEPFALNRDDARPSMFYIEFITGGECFDYAVEAGRDQIVSEELRRIGRGKPARVFRRYASPSSTEAASPPPATVDWGGAIELSAASRRSVEEALGPKNLVLSVLGKLFRSSVTDVMAWFENRVILDRSELTPKLGRSNIQTQTLRRLNEFLTVPENRSAVLEVLRSAEMNISDIRPEALSFEVPKEISDELGESTLSKLLEISEFAGVLKVSPSGMAEIFRILVKHRVSEAGDANREFELDFQDESEGTIALICLLPELQRLLTAGGLMLIDGLDSSLHPLVARLMLKRMCALEAANGQVIFTAHNTSLLSSELLRRDEIVLLDKNRRGRTDLNKLCDFQARKDENFETRYLDGRYGAIPWVDEYTGIMGD